MKLATSAKGHRSFRGPPVARSRGTSPPSASACCVSISRRNTIVRVDGSRPSPHTSRGSTSTCWAGPRPGCWISVVARASIPRVSRGSANVCVGVDFSPASVLHARSEAEKAALPCQYHLEDLVAADLGGSFDLALLIFGELNSFPPADAKTILANTRRAVDPSGALVLEVASEHQVRSLGGQPSTWFGARQSVFSDDPHLCLKECA